MIMFPGCPCCGSTPCEVEAISTEDIELVRSEGNQWHGYRVYKMPDYVAGGNWGGIVSFTFNRPALSTPGGASRYYIGASNPANASPGSDYNVAPNGSVYLPRWSTLHEGQVNYEYNSLQANVRFPWSNYNVPLAWKDDPHFYVHWTLATLYEDPDNPLYYLPPEPGAMLHTGGPSLDSFKTSVYFGSSTTDPLWRNPPNWKRSIKPYTVSPGTESILTKFTLGIDPLYSSLPATGYHPFPDDTSKQVIIRTYDSSDNLLSEVTKNASGSHAIPVKALAPSETKFKVAYDYQWNNTLSATQECADTWHCLKYKTDGWEGWCTEYGWIYNDNGWMALTTKSPPENTNTTGCRNNSYFILDYHTGARLDFWLTDGTANVMLYEGTRRITEAGGTNQIHYTTSDPAVINALAAGEEVDVSTWTSTITQDAPRSYDGRSYISKAGSVLIRLDTVLPDSGGSNASAQQNTCNCGYWPGAFLPTCSSNATPESECYKDLPETFTLQFQPSAFAPISAGGLVYGDLNETTSYYPTKPPWILPTGDIYRSVGTADEYNAGNCNADFLARFQQPIILRKTLTGEETVYISDPLPLRPCTRILYRLIIHEGWNNQGRKATLTSTTKADASGGNLPFDGSGLNSPGFGCQWDKDYWADNPDEHVTAFNGKSYSFFHGRVTATPGGVYTPETIVTCPNSAPDGIGYSYSSNCLGKACPPNEFLVTLSEPSESGTWASALYGDYYVPVQNNPRYCRPRKGFREWISIGYFNHVVDANNAINIYLFMGYFPGTTIPAVLGMEDGCPCGQMGVFMRLNGAASGVGFDTNAPRLPLGAEIGKAWPESTCSAHCISTEKTIEFGNMYAQITGPSFPAVVDAKVTIPAVLP